MALADDIAAQSNGAHFLRADLHIHSYGPGGSYDVRDAGMTPQAIIDLAIAENLQLIAITDHNTVGNVRAAYDYAADKEILLVPGVELSTPDGHLLIYCKTPDQIEAFCARLNISPNKQACLNPMSQCLHLAAEFDGFGICAHVDKESGLEMAHPKFDAFKQEIFNCPNLLGLEITQPPNHDWFSHIDAHADRRNCATIRRTHLGHEEEISLAKVMGSDSHALAGVGKNARNQKRLTRFKMDWLSFDALRIAFLDCAARVRLEDFLPASIPHFVGMKLEGGFLKDQVVYFSRNLTCIIGGRGAGKSTLLESLRVASGGASENSIVDSEVWPDCISLIYEDEVGNRHEMTRTKLGEATNRDPNGPQRINVESYGQGDTAATIHNCDQEPAVLLDFLDGFVNLNEMKERDEVIRDKLLANQGEIERLQEDINRIKEVEALKKTADGQVETLKTQKAADVVLLEQKLAAERQFRDRLRASLTALPIAIANGLLTHELKELIESVDGDALAVGKKQFEAVSELAMGLVTEIEAVSTDAGVKVKIVTDKINVHLASWIDEQQKTRDKIEEIRRELEKQKIKLDMAFIRKVTADAAGYAAKLVELKKSVPKQEAAFKARALLMQERRNLKSKLFMTRQSFATAMNSNLSTCVVEYTVHLKFIEGVLSSELEELVKEAMGWRTSQVPKAALIASKLSPLALIDVIDKKNAATLAAILDEQGNKVFSLSDALAIITKLNEWQHRVAIQRCPFEDRPEIKVAKMINLPNGKRVPSIKDFTKLSLGQQQAILLTVLLFSQSTAPLIIDQPEDNLDSEFVYTTLVRSLRGIKEKRQIIIVTHNANIAVLGDAELIIPLRGQSEHSVIRDRGSIDTDNTKKLVCTILEGSPKAFKRRHEIYGF
jgi:predicted metal-dependent phosphoesterase TrpH/ABC-type lipoprotein export system ATPase subunit